MDISFSFIPDQIQTIVKIIWKLIFLIRKKRKICPIEVKSGVYRKHSSLDKFRSKFKGKIGQPYILYTKDVFVKEEVIHLPIYMAMFL